MPVKTNELRLFRRKIKTGTVKNGPTEGNYIWDHDEPVLQQKMVRTDAEVEMHFRFRNEVVPKEFWIDVLVVEE